MQKNNKQPLNMLKHYIQQKSVKNETPLAPPNLFSLVVAKAACLLVVTQKGALFLTSRRKKNPPIRKSKGEKEARAC